MHYHIVKLSLVFTLSHLLDRKSGAGGRGFKVKGGSVFDPRLSQRLNPGVRYDRPNLALLSSSLPVIVTETGEGTAGFRMNLERVCATARREPTTRFRTTHPYTCLLTHCQRCRAKRITQPDEQTAG